MDYHAQDIEVHSRDLKRNREKMQKKTFTRWINRFLTEPENRVKDLFTDLRDGRRLIRLVEILQKVSIGRPNKSVLRVQKVDNVSRALDVLRSTRKRVRNPRTGVIQEGQPIISGIGNENIVDGDITLTLGLIWQMIRHYHIAVIAEELAANNQGISKEARSVNDALLLWCQQKTKGYPNCEIKDFHKSWNNGMAFNALLHAHRQDAFDYKKLNPSDQMNNLNHAFDVAQEQFGVPRLLDAEDMAVEVPDEKSVIIYVTDLYSALNKAKTEETGSKRVTNFLNDLSKNARKAQSYEANVDDLFNWIKRTIAWLSSRNLPNSIAGLLDEKKKFNDYVQDEKFKKFGELTNLEVLLYDIQTLQRKEGHRVYTPKSGKTLEDLGKAWNELEEAEQEREKALVSELVRQLELEKRAKHYVEVMQPSRLKTMEELSSVIDDMHVDDESASKQIEDVWERLIGIQSAILNQKEIRFKPFYARAKQLIDENYHGKEEVAKIRDNVQAKWDALMDAFKAKEALLKPYADIVALSKEIDALITQLQLMHDAIGSKDVGNHLYAAEDLLAKHNIAAKELSAVPGQMQSLNSRVQKLLSAKTHDKPAMSLSKQLFNLDDEYRTLCDKFNQRRLAIERSRDFFELIQSCEDEEAWLADKQTVLQADMTSKDLRTARRFLNKLKVVEAELKHRRSLKFAQLCTASEKMRQSLNDCPDKQKTIGNWLQRLRKQWDALTQLLKSKQSKVSDDYEAQQFYAAANEADDYMNQVLPIVRSEDFGSDSGSASALLKRHTYLQEELRNFGRREQGELHILRQMADLLTVAADKHKIDIEKLQRTPSRGAERLPSRQGDEQRSADAAADLREIGEPSVEDAAEEEEEEDPLIEVEEPYEDVVTETKVENIEELKRIQRVLVNHSYSSRDPKQRDLSAEKGEIYELVQKTNKDWYSVRDLNTNQRGFLPAVYLTEISPSTITITVPKQIEVQRKVTKSRKVMKRASELSTGVGMSGNQHASGGAAAKAARKRRGAAPIVRRASLRTADTLHSDKENIANRMQEITNNYQQLDLLADARAVNLRDAAKQFKFFQLANTFSDWLTEKEAIFSTEESLAEDSAAIKKRYEKHFQEMAAHKSRLDEINTLAKDLLTGDNQSAASGDVKPVLKKNDESVVDRQAVQKLHKDILDRWERLNKLKLAKEKKLADSSSIERFAKRAQETKDQLEEKRDLLAEFKDLGYDLEANAKLINRHKNLLRDLDLLRDRVSELDYEGKAIKEIHPNESKFIDDKLKKLHDLLAEAAALANTRDKDLVGKKERLLVDADAKKTMEDLERAIDAVMSSSDQLPDDATPSGRQRRPTLADISDEEIENLLAQTEECEKEIDELLKKYPNDPQLLALKNKLAARKAELLNALKKRKQDRANEEQLRKFLRESDRLLTKLNNLSTRLDNMQPSELTDKLRDQRKELDSISSKLEKYTDLGEDAADTGTRIKPRQSEADAEKIDTRLAAIDEAIVKTKAKTLKKSDDLQQAADFANFKEKADELAEWLAEKRIAAGDKSHRDLTNLPSKKQRHRAFEAELAANRPILDALHQEAQVIIDKKHPQSKRVQDYLQRLDKEWDDLVGKSNAKGAEIDEALKEQELLKQLEDFTDQLEKMDKEVSRNDEGKDLRGARGLLDRQKSLDQHLGQCKLQIDDAAKQGKALANQGHYDADKILQSVDKLNNAYEQLLPKLEQRRRQLEESLAYRQFEFDREREMEWIDEHMPRTDAATGGAASGDGRSLNESQMLKQRHANLQQEVDNHQPAFDKVLAEAKPLQSGRYAKPATELADSLANRLDRLNKALKLRDRQLQEAVSVQQYAADLGDIEQQLADCALVLGTLPEAKDPATVNKNLKKLKGLEDELSTLKNQLNQLANRRGQFSDSPEAEALEARHSDLESRLGDLQRRARGQRKDLLCRSEYEQFVQDVEEMREWIDNNLVPAASDDYGTDHDHALQLQLAFDELSANLGPAEEKLKAINKNSESLISSGNPNAPDILKRSTDLKDYWEELLRCMEKRGANLAKAIEIHEYNKDAYDFCQRLDEKKRNIPKEVGRDLKGLEKYMERHNLFMQELLVLDEQLGQLRGKAQTLQAKVDAENGQKIADRQRIVEELYQELEELQKARGLQLTEAHDFFDFMKQKQAIKSWTNDGVLEIDNLMSQPVQPNEIEIFCQRAADMSNQLRDKLDDIKQLVEEGESLCDKDSEFSDEIENVVDEVVAVKETVEDRLQQLADYSANLKAYSEFNDKAAPLLKLYGNIEHKLSVMPVGSSLEQVEHLGVELDAQRSIFEKAAPRLEACEQAVCNAEATIPKGHALLQQVSDRMQNVRQLQKKADNSINNARALLDKRSDYLKFLIDDIEVNDFIQAQSAHISSCFKQNDQQQEASRSDQLRKLQDYKDAVDSHTERIVAHIKHGKQLAADASSPNAKEIGQLVAKTDAEWRKLLQLCADQEKALETARVYLRFLEECEKLQQAMLKVKPLLDSYQSERDKDLYSFIYDALQDFTIDQERINRLKAKCAELLKDPNADHAAVQKQTDKVCRLWDEIKDKLALCRQELAAKVKHNRFCHSADEIQKDLRKLNEAVDNCKPAAASGKSRCDDPKLVADAIKRNVSIRDTEVKKNAQLLVPLKEIAEEFNAANIYPETKKVYDDLEVELDELRRHCNAKDRELQDERRYATAVDGARQFADWVEQFVRKLESEPRSFAPEAVEKQMTKNKDRETEVDRQLESVEYVRNRAADLANQSEEYAELLKQPRQLIDTERTRLKQKFAEHTDGLMQDAKFVDFLVAAGRLERQLRIVESRLQEAKAVPLHAEVKQLGQSLSDLQENFDEPMSNNRNNKAYKQRLDSLQQLYSTVQRLNDTANQQHEAADRLTAFVQHCDNFSGRVSAKLQLVLDDTIAAEEMTKKRIERFATIQAEVDNYKKQLGELDNEGQQLSAILDEDKQELVQHKLEKLHELYKRTESSCSEQLALAKLAYSAKLLMARCSDLNVFCQNCEDLIEANSVFNSLTKAKQAQKNHEGLQADLNAREATLKEIGAAIAEFKKENYKDVGKLEERFTKLQRRFNELRQAASQCTQNLAHAIKVFHFLAEAEDEISWIDSKVALVDSADVGSSTAEVKRLLKRLHQFEEEFDNRRKVVDDAIFVGKELLNSQPAAEPSERTNSTDSSFGSDSSDSNLLFKEQEVRSKLNSLQEKYTSLQAVSKRRKSKLQLAERRFAYLDDLAEAKGWLEERLPGVRTIDLGNDEFVCLSRSKQVETLTIDAEKFEERVIALSEVAKQLSESSDGSLLKRQTEVEQLLQTLMRLLKQHKQKLDENLKFFKFKEYVEELCNWIRSVEMVLNSIEPGSNEEMCEQAIEKCLQAQATLKTRQDKLDFIDAEYHTLQSQKNHRLEEAKALRDLLKNQLAAVHLKAKDQLKSLHDSCKIHHFLYETSCLHEALSEKWLQVQSLQRFGDSQASNEELVRSLEFVADSEMKPLSAKRSDLLKQSELLLEEFKTTDAEQVIVDHVEEVESVWQDLAEQIASKRSDLLAAKEVHNSLLRYKDLLMALQQMYNEIHAEQLAGDFKSAVEQLERSTARAKELKQREHQVLEFNKNATKCKRDCQFMSEFIDNRCANINKAWQDLQELHKQRHELYIEHVDIRRLLDKCSQLNQWMDEFGRDFAECQPEFEHGIDQLDARGKRSEELTALLLAQKPRIEALKELTMLERRFEEQRRSEAKRTKSVAYNEMAASVKKRETQRQQMVPAIMEEPVEARNQQQQQQQQPLQQQQTPLQQQTPAVALRPVSEIPQSVTATAAASDPSGQRKRGLRKSHTFNTQKKSAKGSVRLTDLVPPSIEGDLELRQEYQPGGMKHPIKKWKKRYAALCGHQLAVFKDKSAHTRGEPAMHSLAIRDSKCEIDAEHKHSLRLSLTDESQYLLMLPTTQDCLAWQGQLKFKAALDPSLQLEEFDASSADVTETLASSIRSPSAAQRNSGSTEYRPRSALKSDSSSASDQQQQQKQQRPLSPVGGSATLPSSPAGLGGPVAGPRSPSMTMSPERTSVGGGGVVAAAGGSAGSSAGKSRAAQLKAEETVSASPGHSQTLPHINVSSDAAGDSTVADSQKEKKKGSLFRMFSGRKKKDKP